jgi:lactate dehydrogenase-like 2-hydroxyacid dehydrogenase
MQINVLSICPLSQTQKQRLELRGRLVYHDAELGDLGIGEKCRGADIVLITPRIAIDIVPFLDGCRLISVQGTGTDAINVRAATSKGISVCNVPAVSTEAVAEHAFALLLAATRRISKGGEILRNGTWRSGLAYEVSGLFEKTLGILGFGKIGVRISEIGRSFGMKIVVTTDHPSPERALRHGITFVDFDDLLRQSDYLVLAAPVTAKTHRLFGGKQFAQMKPSAVLVNVSRGLLVDEAALADALRDGLLNAAAQDVFVDEPPSPTLPLLNLGNFVATPHVAWGTSEVIAKLLEISIRNIEAFLDGKALNVVNPETLVHCASPNS